MIEEKNNFLISSQLEKTSFNEETELKEIEQIFNDFDLLLGEKIIREQLIKGNEIIIQSKQGIKRVATLPDDKELKTAIQEKKVLDWGQTLTKLQRLFVLSAKHNKINKFFDLFKKLTMSLGQQKKLFPLLAQSIMDIAHRDDNDFKEKQIAYKAFKKLCVEQEIIDYKKSKQKKEKKENNNSQEGGNEGILRGSTLCSKFFASEVDFFTPEIKNFFNSYCEPIIAGLQKTLNAYLQKDLKVTKENTINKIKALYKKFVGQFDAELLKKCPDFVQDNLGIFSENQEHALAASGAYLILRFISPFITTYSDTILSHSKDESFKNYAFNAFFAIFQQAVNSIIAPKQLNVTEPQNKSNSNASIKNKAKHENELVTEIRQEVSQIIEEQSNEQKSLSEFFISAAKYKPCNTMPVVLPAINKSVMQTIERLKEVAPALSIKLLSQQIKELIKQGIAATDACCFVLLAPVLKGEENEVHKENEINPQITSPQTSRNKIETPIEIILANSKQEPANLFKLLKKFNFLEPAILYFCERNNFQVFEQYLATKNRDHNLLLTVLCLAMQNKNNNKLCYNIINTIQIEKINFDLNEKNCFHQDYLQPLIKLEAEPIVKFLLGYSVAHDNPEINHRLKEPFGYSQQNHNKLKEINTLAISYPRNFKDIFYLPYTWYPTRAERIDTSIKSLELALQNVIPAIKTLGNLIVQKKEPQVIAKEILNLQQTEQVKDILMALDVILKSSAIFKSITAYNSPQLLELLDRQLILLLTLLMNNILGEGENISKLNEILCGAAFQLKNLLLEKVLNKKDHEITVLVYTAINKMIAQKFFDLNNPLCQIVVTAICILIADRPEDMVFEREKICKEINQGDYHVYFAKAIVKSAENELLKTSNENNQFIPLPLPIVFLIYSQLNPSHQENLLTSIKLDMDNKQVTHFFEQYASLEQWLDKKSNEKKKSPLSQCILQFELDFSQRAVLYNVSLFFFNHLRALKDKNKKALYPPEKLKFIGRISQQFEVFFVNFLRQGLQDDNVKYFYARRQIRLDFYLKKTKESKSNNQLYFSILYELSPNFIVHQLISGCESKFIKGTNQMLKEHHKDDKDKPEFIVLHALTGILEAKDQKARLQSFNWQNCQSMLNKHLLFYPEDLLPFIALLSSAMTNENIKIFTNFFEDWQTSDLFAGKNVRLLSGIQLTDLHHQCLMFTLPLLWLTRGSKIIHSDVFSNLTGKEINWSKVFAKLNDIKDGVRSIAGNKNCTDFTREKLKQFVMELRTILKGKRPLAVQITQFTEDPKIKQQRALIKIELNALKELAQELEPSKKMSKKLTFQKLIN